MQKIFRTKKTLVQIVGLIIYIYPDLLHGITVKIITCMYIVRAFERVEEFKYLGTASTNQKSIFFFL